MDQYVHAICSCFSIAVAETSVNKQSGLWIRRDHTLHIQCGNVTLYVDGCVNRDLIELRNNSNYNQAGLTFGSRSGSGSVFYLYLNVGLWSGSVSELKKSSV
jgi:hypothetical protein